ncbi:hypothetical protein KU6B_35500 [Mameliella alba]|uniref:hypothetical protein n=1 Tax=Mameliella alba TaxID=561184 RepID=UPI0013E41EAD|nr:hypothetical protein [Mameliella alba]BBU57285.1 hypothetical protein KU6B_35500 [Mameliella alba]
MSNTSLLLGAGGLVIGVLAGVAFSGSDSPADLRKVIDDTVVPAQEAAEKAAKAHGEQLAALQKRLDALETGLAENAPDMSALTAGLSKEMTTKLDDLRTKLGDDIAKTSAAQAETIKTSLADLSKGIEETTRVAAAAAAAPADAGPDATEVPEPDSGMASADALSVGDTALFADGAVRAFVSRIDPAGGSVRLSVNGSLVTLGAGGSTPVSMDGRDCSVTVASMSDRGVTLGSDCGVIPPAVTVAAPDNGVLPGHTVSLADGALRVFVSSVDSEGQEARIAVNGVQTQRVAADSSLGVDVGDQSCTLRVTGIGEGMIGFDASCG